MTVANMDFDAVLERCGGFNRYQFIMLMLYGYTNILASIHYFAQTLVSFTPDHWCYNEQLANSSFETISQAYAPFEDQKCTVLEDIVNGTGVKAENETCDRWIYQYEKGYRSITTDLNWVCEDAYKPAVGQSLFFVGSVFGTIVFGFFADKIGRLPSLIMSILAGAAGDFLTSFVNSLPTFSVGRFISGLSTDAIFYMMYIIVFEYLSPRKRTFGINIIVAFFYCIGLMLSPWFAIWVSSWRYFLLIASLPAIGVLSFPFIICESAQWLITKEKYEGAVRCLKRVAKINGRVVEDQVFDEFVAYYKQKMIEEKKIKDHEDTFWGMFRTPRLRKFTIILLIKSMITTLSFDILSRNMEGIGISPFVLFSITAIVSIPAGLTLILLQNVIGRKGMACGGSFVASIVTAITAVMVSFLDNKENWLVLAIMVGIGRYVGTVAYDSEAQYAAEIIPTSVRGRCMANIHVVGYAFSFLSSYVIYLGLYFKPAPFIFICVIMIVCTILCLQLPETLDKKLPETLNDGENFGKGEPWYFFPCFKQAPQKTVTPTAEITRF